MRSRRIVACAVVFAALWYPARAEAITNPQIPGLQVALRAKGLYPGPIDGIAGKRTLAALNAYRQSISLAPVLAVNRETIGRLQYQ